ncbi:MAG: hypothetical protein IKZ90_08875 [Clostridiales bacterium]|nr:hypothetical protein [Clostridiales bacterium]
MTRSFFKGLTLRASVCVILSLGFLISCLFYTRRANYSREQKEYQEIYGSLLLASEYRPLTTDVLKNHEDVKAVFSAYDETGRLIGYIVDVATQTAAGYIHTQMSISENGENLLNIRVVETEEGGPSYTEEEMELLRSQIEGKRIPIAIEQDLPSDVPYQVDYDPLLGLHDGVYYAQAEKAASDGYLDYCEIEVSGGRIVRVTWDGVNEQTKKTRSEDSISGEYKISGNIWAEQAYRLGNHLVLVQDPVKLAMKSDGKTEIIEGVTIDISTFVQLVNKCIANSRASITKSMSLNEQKSSDDPGGEDTKETENTPTPMPSDSNTSETETVPAETTRAPSEIGVIGGEDGVVSGDSGNILSESVDGIPLSEIRAYIDGIPDDPTRSAALLSTVNSAYKFIREYLNWVG